MKKLTTMLAAASLCLAAFSHPGPAPRGPRPVPRGPVPRMHTPPPGPRIHYAPPPPHRHHHSRGAFWTGLGVGLVGSLLLPPAPPPAPVVIQAAPQRVWVPPVYGERPIYRAGIYVGVERYIITPGYWTTTY